MGGVRGCSLCVLYVVIALACESLLPFSCASYVMGMDTVFADRSALVSDSLGVLSAGSSAMDAEENNLKQEKKVSLLLGPHY